ncbi:tyrosine-type recombinase/integrase [Nocardiopsis alba]|uniref:tyrosine-type recombinase/integrase n=1 Tax=Nocardiopsis alba TaxID=53437 RepID=UPI0035DF21CB
MTDDKRTRVPDGRSSIYFSPADGYWHGWVTMGLKNDGSPDRRHRMAKGEAAVTAKVQELEAIRDAGKPSKAGRAPTLAEWMTTYLETILPLRVRSGKMAPRTLEDYESKARNWIIPLLGEHRVTLLRAEHIEEAYAQMFRERLSQNSVIKVHAILSRALKVAVQRHVITQNPAALVELGSPEEAEIEPYSRAEARAILSAVRGRRNEARWAVALGLGVRQGEALGLRWKYVVAVCPECHETKPFARAPETCPECGSDFRVSIRAWFQVQPEPYRHGCDDPTACSAPHHKVKCKRGCKSHGHTESCRKGCKRAGHNCIKRGCPKSCAGHAAQCPEREGGGWVFLPRKGKRKLTLSCPPELVPLLREHRKRQSAERLKAGGHWADYDLVFPGTYGQPVGRSEDWRQWKAVCTRAGVRESRQHDARHTAASLLVEQGVHLRTVQEILGHARVTTTQRYAHVATPLAEEAAERMGDALFG